MLSITKTKQSLYYDHALRLLAYATWEKGRQAANRREQIQSLKQCADAYDALVNDENKANEYLYNHYGNVLKLMAKIESRKERQIEHIEKSQLMYRKAMDANPKELRYVKNYAGALREQFRSTSDNQQKFDIISRTVDELIKVSQTCLKLIIDPQCRQTRHVYVDLLNDTAISVRMKVAMMTDRGAALETLNNCTAFLDAAHKASPENHFVLSSYGNHYFFKALLEKDPGDKKKCCERGLKMFEDSHQKKSDDAITLAHWGRMLWLDGLFKSDTARKRSFDTAVEKFREALKIRPDDLWTKAFLGWVNFEVILCSYPVLKIDADCIQKRVLRFWDEADEVVKGYCARFRAAFEIYKNPTEPTTQVLYWLNEAKNSGTIESWWEAASITQFANFTDLPAFKKIWE